MTRVWWSLAYVGFVLAELVRGGLALGRDVLTPGSSHSPAIVEYPLRCRTDLEITLMASSITITPGTLVIGTAAARGGEPAALFVHALYATSREALVTDLAEMERRLLRATRGEGGTP